MVRISSFVGSVGERAVSWIEVNGKVEEFGFPASMEIRPGLLSSGMRLLTVTAKKRSASTNHQIEEKTLTWTRYPRLRDIRQESVVVFLGQGVDHIVPQIE